MEKNYSHISFKHIKFEEQLQPATVFKWKEHPPGTYYIASKEQQQSKYGPTFILELVDSASKKITKVYTPKYITTYLTTNTPAYVKLTKEGEHTRAQFGN